MATSDWSQHPHMSSQHNNNTTTSHFGIFFHILIISKLHGSFQYMGRYPCWLDVYSYLIADEQVRWG